MSSSSTEPEAAAASDGRVRLTGIEAAKVHVTFGVALIVCTAAFWFEIHRALSGNSLSWAYVFEWPLFGVFSVYMWWVTLRGGRRDRKPPPPPTVAPEHQAMLEAWQEHRRHMEEEAMSSRAATPLPEERT